MGYSGTVEVTSKTWMVAKTTSTSGQRSAASEATSQVASVAFLAVGLSAMFWAWLSAWHSSSIRGSSFEGRSVECSVSRRTYVLGLVWSVLSPPCFWTACCLWDQAQGCVAVPEPNAMGSLACHNGPEGWPDYLAVLITRILPLSVDVLGSHSDKLAGRD